MICGQQPFNGATTDAILAAVQRANVAMNGGCWRKVSNSGKGLIKALLQKTPSARPPAAQALSHAWFSDTSNGEELESLGHLEVENLRAFSRMNKVKKAALTIVATQLSDKRITQLKNLFMSLDRNNDGTLSLAELKQGLKNAGVKIPRDFGQVLEQVDTDGSGVLDYTEFVAATMDKKWCNQESIVWAAFRKFDVDGSGTISVQELTKVLGDDDMKDQMQVTGDPTKIQEIFAEIDVNGDGEIDFDEFFAMVRTVEDDVRDVVATKNQMEPRSPPRSPKSSRSESRKATTASNMSEGNARPSPRRDTSPRSPGRSARRKTRDGPDLAERHRRDGSRSPTKDTSATLR
jgi:calcium-dependent protein kinase